ncbi:MAG: class I SAM-dependent methyltransferase [Candidatus Hydrogenedentales bacterium]
MTPSESVTRGHGLLERFLARKRRDMADSLIPEAARAGRILDIGCGSFPLFLTSTRFAGKYGLERVADGQAIERFKKQGIALLAYDLETATRLPFEDGFFDVVTMLAVFEHLNPQMLIDLTREVRRILKPGGVYVLTTPASGTAGILKILSALRLVSSEEIDEHKDAYSRSDVAETLRAGGFSEDAIAVGLFELGLNIWAKARK